MQGNYIFFIVGAFPVLRNPLNRYLINVKKKSINFQKEAVGKLCLFIYLSYKAQRDYPSYRVRFTKYNIITIQTCT